MKSVAIVRTIPAAVAANAHTLRRARTSTTASTSAATASSAGSTGGKTSFSLRSTATATVTPAKSAASTAAGRESLRADVAARSQSSPVVRRVRNAAPWNANSATNVTPASSEYGVKRSARLPAQSLLESSGTPPRRLASAIPQSIGTPKLATVFAAAQNARHRVPSPFSRHSNETTRRISSTRISRSAR